MKELLGRLGEKTSRPVRSCLAEEIKENISSYLPQQRRSRDTINIIIDFRINKLAAAVAIIVTLFLCANLFDINHSGDNSIFEEGRYVVNYCLRSVGLGSVSSEQSAGLTQYERLVGQGFDVVYYGNNIDWSDSRAILMQWKVGDNEYKVLFSDLREKKVSGEELIELQAKMLKKK